MKFDLKDSTMFPLLLWLTAAYVVYWQLLPNVHTLKSIYVILLLVSTYVSASFFVVLNSIFPNLYSYVKNKGAIVGFSIKIIGLSCLFMHVFNLIFDVTINPTFMGIFIHNMVLTVLAIMLSIGVYDTEDYELVFIKNNSILMSVFVSVYNICYVLMYYK